MTAVKSNKWRDRAIGGLVFVSTLLAGWQLGGSDKSNAGGAESVERQDRAPRRVTRRATGGSAAAEAARKMRMLRQAGTPDERMRATIDLVNNLPISEIGKWMDGNWFDLREGFDQTLFHKIAMERWQLEDPEGMISWSLKSESGVGNAMLADWAEREPQRVIDYFRSNPNDSMEINALAGIARNDPGLALERLREMSEAGLSTEAMGRSRGLLGELAKSSPQALEGLLDSLPDSMRFTAESSLVVERMKESFSEEIEQLWERPDGWRLFERSFPQSKTSVGQLIELLGDMPVAWKSQLSSSMYSVMDSKEAKLWLEADLAGSGFSEEQVGRIQGHAVESMISNDPEGALGLLDQTDDQVRTRALQKIINQVMRDPERLDAVMAMLTTEEDRQIAQSQIDARSATSSEVVSEPKGWLEKVSEAKGFNHHPLTLASNLWSMNPEQLDELATEFKGLPDESKTAAAVAIGGLNSYHYGSSELRLLRGEAIRYLMGVEEGSTSSLENSNGGSRYKNVLSEASRFAVDWMEKDPQAAGQWALSLPLGKTRGAAQKSLAANWAQYDPKAARQWVNSLPAEERSAVSEFMEQQLGN